MLQIQNLSVVNRKGRSITAVTLWDAGSTLSFITFQFAERMHLQGNPIKLEIVTVGGDVQQIESYRYTIFVRDQQGQLVEMEVLGIRKISTDIELIDTSKIATKFKKPEAKQVSNRPVSGCIDMLMGFQYAAYHPVCIDSVEHLLLMKNRFGVIVAGSHPTLKERTRKLVQHAVVLHATESDEFFSMESLGVSCSPACGSCKCGKCNPGAKNMTLLEEKELDLIKSDLSFDAEAGRWMAKYPWIKEPSSLPDNKHVAVATLKSTERRLKKNPLHGEIYKRQMEDMLQRKVAREVSDEELNQYEGPKFYLTMMS